jgi:hypothetical protein
MEDKVMELISLPFSEKLPTEIRYKVHEAGFKFKNKTKV